MPTAKKAKPQADPTETGMRYEKAYPIANLKPFPGNPRIHPDSEIQMLIKNIRHFGWTNPVLVQEGTNNVIAGHGRIQAAKKMKRKTVPVLVWKVNDQDALAHMVADNRLGALSGWDIPKLKDILGDLEGNSFDIELTGFTDVNVDTLLGQENNSDFLDNLGKKNGGGDDEPDDDEPDEDGFVKLTFVLQEGQRDLIQKRLRKIMEDKKLANTSEALVQLVKATRS